MSFPEPIRAILTRRDSYTRFPRPIGVIAALTEPVSSPRTRVDPQGKVHGGLRRRAQVEEIRARPRAPPDADPHVLRGSRRECFDIDDIRCVWEEFVDALRDASAKTGDPRPKDTSTSYADVEQPALQRSPSFARLVENLSSEASGASTRAPPRSTSCRGTA